jgi:GMP synthase (glutamine-hydrolysing)
MKGKILILITGELPRRVTDRHGLYDRAFLSLLGEKERCVVIDAQKDSLPEPMWEGIIVSGSASSTYEGDMWIRRSEEFLRQAADREVPVYGICFGHQLVAQAFGGKVEKCPRGWELGTVPFLVNPEARGDPLFNGLPEEFEVQQSHGDVVSELPPGAVCLGKNSHWPIQAFRLGDKIWGTQFHPEFTPAIMEELVQALTGVLPAKAFPNHPPDPLLKKRILSDLRDSPHAPDCLRNFMHQVSQNLS